MKDRKFSPLSRCSVDVSGDDSNQSLSAYPQPLESYRILSI